MDRWQKVKDMESTNVTPCYIFEVKIAILLKPSEEQVHGNAIEVYCSVNIAWDFCDSTLEPPIHIHNSQLCMADYPPLAWISFAFENLWFESNGWGVSVDPRPASTFWRLNILDSSSVSRAYTFLMGKSKSCCIEITFSVHLPPPSSCLRPATDYTQYTATVLSSKRKKAVSSKISVVAFAFTPKTDGQLS